MLSTTSVTSQLTSWPGLREPAAVGTAIPFGELLPTGPNDTRPPLFGALHALMAPGLQSNSYLNFEHLVHVAEQLASMMPIPSHPKTVDPFRFWLAPLFDVKHSNWNVHGATYAAAASEACYEILDWFKTTCDAVSLPTHPLARGIKQLALKNTLRIFSLNYDDIVQRSGVPLYTGFLPSTGPRRFEPKFPWPRGGHCLCQLHGSVLWGNDAFEIVAFDHRNAAANARKARSSGSKFGDGHQAPNAPMITGLRKADKVLSRPFGTYFHVFREELLRCRRWLIVGYSFADPHVNHALQQALRNWEQRGTPVRAVVVDYFDATLGGKGPPVLDAWIGTDAGERLTSLCMPVFSDAASAFMAQRLPKLASSLFTELSANVAVDFAGTTTALTSHMPLMEKFLRVPPRNLAVRLQDKLAAARAAFRST